ncbi:MAG: methionine synthase, partial [Cyclobacteriaceae bacterium]|nr:methionine synthase [Cyclobacteriaceae bacterium]
ICAEEMERMGLKIPLLIGGATTSRVHTAVKIAPRYSGSVSHVLDASKAVTVASLLLSESANNYVAQTRTEYEELAENHRNRQKDKDYLPYTMALQNKWETDWESYTPPAPSFLGNKTFDDISLEEIRPFIDWTPFFSTWMLKGKYPAILEDNVVGEEAGKLFHEANQLLDRIIDGKLLSARAVIGFYEANSDGDDVILSSHDAGKLHFLRQQGKKGAGISNICLADFIAPQSSGKRDYIGAFAVTAGIGIEAMIAAFEAEHDDYQIILVKAIADRLAEALAEYMHYNVRITHWGYASGEQLTNEQLIREEYKGIRPAPGYPACPDHTEKQTLFELLQAEKNTGISLSESFAMYPASSVSGFYFSHPGSRYFGLGKIGEDQVADYARRKQMDKEEIERWLAPVLNY